MLDAVGHFKDALLRHEALHLVAPDDVAFLQRLDGEVLAAVLVLRQYHLPITNIHTRHHSSERRFDRVGSMLQHAINF